MSAAAVVGRPSLPVCEVVASILELVGGNDPADARGSNRLVIRAHGARAVHLPTLPPNGASRRLPGPLLALLEGDPPLPVHLAVPVADAYGTAARRLGALIGTIAVGTVYRNPTKPASPYGRQHILDVPGLAAAEERFLSAFLPPSLIVSAGIQVSGLWALREPLALTDPRGAFRARALHAAIARAIGGVQAAKDEPFIAAAGPILGAVSPPWALPLPGSAIAAAQRGEVVAVHLDPSIVYGLDEIEAALGGAAKE